MADVDELLTGAETLVPVPRDVADGLLEDLVARLTKVEASETVPLLAAVAPQAAIHGHAAAAARRRHRRRWGASVVAAAAAVALVAAVTGPGGRATLDVVDPPDAETSPPAPTIVVPTRSPLAAASPPTTTVSPPARGEAPVDVPPRPTHDPGDRGGRPGAPAPTRNPGARATFTPVYAAFSDPEGDANRVPVSDHPARAGSDPAADIVEVALTRRTADTFGFRVELSGRPSEDVVYYLVSTVVDGCTFYWTTRIELYSVSRVWCDNGTGSRDRLYEIYGDPIVTDNSVGGEFSREVLPPSIRGMVIPRLQGDTCYVEEPVYRPDQCSSNQTLADMALSPDGWQYVM